MCSTPFRVKVMFWIKMDIKIKVALISEIIGTSEASINTQTNELRWGQQKIVMNNDLKQISTTLGDRSVKIQNIDPLAHLLNY